MPRFDVTEANLSGCRKPGCHVKRYQRHHKRYETLWCRVWSIYQQPKLRELLARYEEFRPEDVVEICGRHHAEIHFKYKKIIHQFQINLGKSLTEFTWGGSGCPHG